MKKQSCMPYQLSQSGAPKKKHFFLIKKDFIDEKC